MNKKIIKYCLMCLMALPTLLACEKSETVMFDTSKAAAHFTVSPYNVYNHSFMLSGNEMDVIELPFYILGGPKDMERSANVTVIADSTTVEAGTYKVVSAIVPANAIVGVVTIEVNKPSDQVLRRIYLRMSDSSDFTCDVTAQSDFELFVADALVRPVSWTSWMQKWRVGTYSTSYYQLIIEATGYTTIPGDGPELESMLSTTAEYLLKKNIEAGPGNELLHSDGYAEGLPVIVRHYYQE